MKNIRIKNIMVMAMVVLLCGTETTSGKGHRSYTVKGKNGQDLLSIAENKESLLKKTEYSSTDLLKHVADGAAVLATGFWLKNKLKARRLAEEAKANKEQAEADAEAKAKEGEGKAKEDPKADAEAKAEEGKAKEGKGNVEPEPTPAPKKPDLAQQEKAEVSSDQNMVKSANTENATAATKDTNNVSTSKNTASSKGADEGESSANAHDAARGEGEGEGKFGDIAEDGLDVV